MPPVRASLFGVRGLPRPIAPQVLMVSRSASGGYRRRRLTPGRLPLQICLLIDQESTKQKPSIGEGSRGGVGSLWVSRGRVTLGEPTL